MRGASGARTSGMVVRPVSNEPFAIMGAIHVVRHKKGGVTMAHQPKWFEHMMRGSVIVVLGVLEDLLYAVLGLFLIVAALWTVGSFLSNLHTLPPSLWMTTALDRFLLALMMLELLHTILLFLRTHRFSHEPFLVVGIIAGIRRVLVVTAQQSTVHRMVETQYLMDLSVTVLVVVLLTLALRWGGPPRRR